MRTTTMLLALLLAACSGDTEGTATDEGTPTGETGETTTPGPTTPPTTEERVTIILGLTGDTTAGETTFTMQCSTCHGADGTGTAQGADLTARLPTLADEDIVRTILTGKGNMDAYDFLDDQTVADVFAYITTSFQ